MVTAILWHLPEFDPGDLRSKEDEGRLEFDSDEVLAIFERIWMGFEGGLKREVDGIVSLSLGLPLTKPDCLLRVLMVAVRARKLVRHRFRATVIQLPVMMTVISRHFQSLNEFGMLLGLIVCDFWAIENLEAWFVEEEQLEISEKIWEFWVKLQSKEEKGNKVFNGFTPNPISKHCFLCSCIGLVGAPFGEPGQKHKWTDWAALQLPIPSDFGNFGHQ
ncbi:hypothetical protein Dsin_005297 [Dipteronia sinensis]|uniref:Uncharacterized protein n=1 Tax=Dipteronia sinensis TaxID=43782 RepID=A0AAE0AX67_9ROSI|nr:hypothetical protein Dsin_005297 [Dipteronia sinensis]